MAQAVETGENYDYRCDTVDMIMVQISGYYTVAHDSQARSPTGLVEKARGLR
jgi:hypothetical protein